MAEILVLGGGALAGVLILAVLAEIYIRRSKPAKCAAEHAGRIKAWERAHLGRIARYPSRMPGQSSPVETTNRSRLPDRAGHE